MLILVTAVAVTACGGSDVSIATSLAPTPTSYTGAVSMAKQYDAPPALTINPDNAFTATFKTAKGDIVFELFAKDAPNTVNNFVFLARERFYDNTTFHRGIPGFMAQGGDPQATGAGGPGYQFRDEFNAARRHAKPGMLSMANAGPGTNGSQFFIMHGNVPLPKQYTIFGQATKGLDVIDIIAATPTTMSATGEQSSPTEEIRIDSVEIIEGS